MKVATRWMAALVFFSIFILVGSVRAEPSLPSAPKQTIAGTLFTYQGRLKSAGGPVTATCQMAFRLYDDPGGGILVSSPITQAVSVAAGLFTTGLDFGAGAMNGDARWLAIAVKCPPDSGFTPLSPRQALTPAPLALALPGLRTQSSFNSPNIIGGYRGNVISDTVSGGVIGGGGQSLYINRVTANFGTVSGGSDNTASGDSASVGGGESNTAGSYYANVSGGYSNVANGDYSTVPGGEGNVAQGTDSLAAGSGAQANHTGTFVWSDGNGPNFASTGNYQFLIRASGGVGINRPDPAASLDVSGTVRVSSGATTGTAISGIQAGTATLGTGLTGVNVYTVTFSSAFAAAPKVILSPRGNAFGGGPVSDTFAVTTRQVTPTYFVVNVYFASGGGTGWSQNLQLDWFAWQ